LLSKKQVKYFTGSNMISNGPVNIEEKKGDEDKQ